MNFSSDAESARLRFIPTLQLTAMKAGSVNGSGLCATFLTLRQKMNFLSPRGP